MNEKLTQLFGLAKSQKELIDSAAARNIISKKSYVTKTTKINFTLMKTILIGLIVSTSLITYYGTGKSSEKTITQHSHLETIASNELVNEETQIVQTENLQQEILESHNSHRIVKRTPSEKQQKSKWHLDVNEVDTNKTVASTEGVVEDIQDTIKTNENELKKSRAIVLDKTELMAFGLYVKDGIIMFEKSNTEWGKVQANFEKERGLNYSVSNHISLEQKKDPIPYFVSLPDGNFLFLLFALDKLDSLNMKEYSKVCPTLLPIWFQESETETPIIFWFANDEHTRRLLPVKFQEALKKDLNCYSNSLVFYRPISDKDNYIQGQQLVEFNQNQVVEINNKLRSKLGFRKGENLYFKKRKGLKSIKIFNKNGGFHFYTTGCIESTIEDNIKKQFPKYVTTTKILNDFGVYSIKCNRKSQDEIQSFRNDHLTLIAIKVPFDKGTFRLFWYECSESLLELLSEEDRTRVETQINHNKKLMSEQVVIGTGLTKPLDYAQIAGVKSSDSMKIKGVNLNQTQLNNLGINVIDKKISLSIPSNKEGIYSTTKLTFGKNGTQINLLENIDGIDTSKYVLPALITSIDGSNMRAGFDGKEMSNVELSLLIPIVVSSGDVLTTLDKINNSHHPDLVFWYEPTDKFLSLLDTQTSIELKSDMNAIQCARNNSMLTSPEDVCDKGTEMTCKYYESCENSIKKAVSGYKLYPNPTKHFFNLNLELSQECNLTVKIMTINGALVQESQYLKVKAGTMSDKIELTNLSPGMYLVYIYSDKGDIITERIIITE